MPVQCHLAAFHSLPQLRARCAERYRGRYGMSVTEPCMDWASTVTALDGLAAAVLTALERRALPFTAPPSPSQHSSPSQHCPLSYTALPSPLLSHYRCWPLFLGTHSQVLERRAKSMPTPDREPSEHNLVAFLEQVKTPPLLSLGSSPPHPPLAPPLLTLPWSLPSAPSFGFPRAARRHRRHRQPARAPYPAAPAARVLPRGAGGRR